MKVTVTYNDKSVQVNLTDAQLETLGLKEKKKPTGYERGEAPGDEFYYVAFDGLVETSHEVSVERDRVITGLYNVGNYFTDKHIANNHSRADTLMRRLRRFAAENGGIPSAEDWENSFVDKHYISWFYPGIPEIRVQAIRTSRDAFQIYFKSKEACKKAIEEFKDELTWYFTEYQAMLY